MLRTLLKAIITQEIIGRKFIIGAACELSKSECMAFSLYTVTSSGQHESPCKNPHGIQLQAAHRRGSWRNV